MDEVLHIRLSGHEGGEQGDARKEQWESGDRSKPKRCLPFGDTILFLLLHHHVRRRGRREQEQGAQKGQAYARVLVRRVFSLTESPSMGYG